MRPIDRFAPLTLNSVKDPRAPFPAYSLSPLGENARPRQPSPIVTRADSRAWPLHASAVRQRRATYTETGWEVFAQGLTECLVWVKTRYGNPVTYVTENGAAFFDPPRAENNHVADPLRVDYLDKHIRAIHAAIARGVDLRGYFVWSLLDNFEWSLGYSKRFGIVHVDFETQVRTPKDSARFYSKVIASRGRALNPPPGEFCEGDNLSRN